HRVPAALGVRADDAPIVFAHPLHQLRRRFAGKAHRLERWSDGTVGGQPLGESLLVIPVQDRLRLRQQAADAYRGHHLAVRQVMCDLAGRPLAVDAAVELLLGDAVERLHHRPVAIAVLLDQTRAVLGIHVKNPTVYAWGCWPRPTARRSSGCCRWPGRRGRCPRPMAACTSRPTEVATRRYTGRGHQALSRTSPLKVRRGWCLTRTRHRACWCARTLAATRSGSWVYSRPAGIAC